MKNTTTWKTAISIFAAIGGAFFLSSCEEKTTSEKIGDEVEDKVEDVKDKSEDVVEETGEAIEDASE